MGPGTPNPLTALGRLTVDAPDDAALEKAVRDRVTPGFTFRQAGRRTDVEGYLAHLRALRSTFTSGEITVLDELVAPVSDPVRAAVRFTMVMHRPDGSLARGESHAFAALHDIGRFLEAGDDLP